jgi:6-phosphogluconolactonase
VSSGAGPRHLDFAPDGSHAFVINEVDSTLTSFRWDADRGALVVTDTRSTLPEGWPGDSTCAQVRVHPSGRFVYGSNRGHDSIAIFAVQSSGKIVPAGHELSGGRTPRNFNLTPDGAWLLAANQNSDSIVSFRVDAATGGLHASGAVTHTNKPVCIVFA